MKKIGIIGFGTIGKKLYEQIVSEGIFEVSFIYDTGVTDTLNMPILTGTMPNEDILKNTDLVVEVALSSVALIEGKKVLKHCDFMPFSTTCFADEEGSALLIKIAEEHKHRIFIPHGAVLGLDGIFDGRELITKSEITTIKNPKSLGRADLERTVVYTGATREICKLMPRNVNVHAAFALAGAGLDNTISTLISDPNIKENTHIIKVDGGDVSFEISIKSNPIGAVTGSFTPVSAYGSVKRALNGEKSPITIV